MNHAAAQKIVYIDLDNTLADFGAYVASGQVTESQLAQSDGNYDEIPGIFAKFDPVPGAVAAFHELAAHFDVYILSTAPWNNPSAWSDKLEWVKRHFGDEIGKPPYKRVILSHHKHLNHGDYLIDDRHQHNGSDKFTGELIHFATEQFLDWDAVLAYLIPALPENDNGRRR